MELKGGYKQTEVGVIPEDWEAVFLGSLVTFQSGAGIAVTTLHQQDSGELVPVYGGNGIAGYTTQALVKEPTIVVGRVGQKCGEVYVTTGQAWITDNALYPLGFHCPIDIHFLALALTAAGLNEVKNRNDLPLVTQSILQSVRIPIPGSTTEQEAIAGALSDADALINSLEQLLVKKRQIKRGAMQELLTGERRLPGFSGPWKDKRLDELGKWVGGMTPSMANPGYWKSGTVPWISSGDVKSTKLFTTASAITDYAVRQSATNLLAAGAIVVVTRSGILRKHLPVAMNMVPMAINQDVKALLPADQVVPEFLLHTLIGNGERILARCLKSGTTVESIEFSWLKAFTLSIPSIPEQSAIASTLSDMDAEIVELKAKIAKARRIKEGMMQELLTGRIRLVRPASEATALPADDALPAEVGSAPAASLASLGA